MADERVSVRAVIGVPLYNGSRFLESAVGSLLAQEGVPFAVVLVDDGSQDETVSIARRLAAEDPRVSVYENPVRLGLAANWSRCLQLARELHSEADYFAWGSDHDRWRPGWLSALVRQLDGDRRAVCAYPGAVWISEHGKPLKAIRHFDLEGERRPVMRLIRAAVGMTAGNMVYGLHRVDVLEDVGGFPAVLLPDRLLLMRMALAGELRQVDDVLWERRRLGTPSLARQRATIFPRGAPRWSRLPVWAVHATCILGDHRSRGTASSLTPLQRGVATTSILALALDTKARRRRANRVRLRAWRAYKHVRKPLRRRRLMLARLRRIASSRAARYRELLRRRARRWRLRVWRGRKRARRRMARLLRLARSAREAIGRPVS